MNSGSRLTKPSVQIPRGRGVGFGGLFGAGLMLSKRKAEES